MRIILFISILFSPWSISYVGASGGEKAGSTIPHTEHPPHDHPSHDHVKKLDEGLRRSRRKNEN